MLVGIDVTPAIGRVRGVVGVRLGFMRWLPHASRAVRTRRTHLRLINLAMRPVVASLGSPCLVELVRVSPNDLIRPMGGSMRPLAVAILYTVVDWPIVLDRRAAMIGRELRHSIAAHGARRVLPTKIHT